MLFPPFTCARFLQHHTGCTVKQRAARLVARSETDAVLGGLSVREERNVNEAPIGRAFEKFALKATEWTGRSSAFVIALAVVIAWAAMGSLFQYSDTWQLVINTGTTIVTFLMVFLIQRAQNKDAKAIQLKLNELVGGTRGASNRLIDIEELSEDELEALHRHYRRLADSAQRLNELHAIEEESKRVENGDEGERKPKERKR
jgi:low affinity Fe/Cu permease